MPVGRGSGTNARDSGNRKRQNTHMDSLYQWRTVGEVGQNAPTTATKAEATVSNAYEVAKAGGPHRGWMEKQRTLPTVKLLKSIRSLEKQIAQHQQWIEDPRLKVPAEMPAEEMNYYVTTKWPNDIARQRQQIDIIRGVLHERNINET